MIFYHFISYRLFVNSRNILVQTFVNGSRKIERKRDTFSSPKSRACVRVTQRKKRKRTRECIIRDKNIRQITATLKNLSNYNLLNTVHVFFVLLSIVIIKQSVHIKYTKSTQRQKRLVFSKKLPIKFLSCIFFFLFHFYLLIYLFHSLLTLVSRQGLAFYLALDPRAITEARPFFSISSFSFSLKKKKGIYTRAFQRAYDRCFFDNNLIISFVFSLSLALSLSLFHRRYFMFA